MIGVSGAKHHLLLNPFSGDVLDQSRRRNWRGYERNKKTFKVPLDWKVDPKLLLALVDARLAEVS